MRAAHARQQVAAAPAPAVPHDPLLEQVADLTDATPQATVLSPELAAIAKACEGRGTHVRSTTRSGAQFHLDAVREGVARWWRTFKYGSPGDEHRATMLVHQYMLAAVEKAAREIESALEEVES